MLPVGGRMMPLAKHAVSCLWQEAYFPIYIYQPVESVQ